MDHDVITCHRKPREFTRYLCNNAHGIRGNYTWDVRLYDACPFPLCSKRNDYIMLGAYSAF